jgi:hypothetical protein
MPQSAHHVDSSILEALLLLTGIYFCPEISAQRSPVPLSEISSKALGDIPARQQHTFCDYHRSADRNQYSVDRDSGDSGLTERLGLRNHVGRTVDCPAWHAALSEIAR